MKKVQSLALVVCGLCLLCASAVAAADFDGSKPLLFSVISVLECTPEEGCAQVTAESISGRVLMRPIPSNSVVVAVCVQGI